MSHCADWLQSDDSSQPVMIQQSKHSLHRVPLVMLAQGDSETRLAGGFSGESTGTFSRSMQALPDLESDNTIRLGFCRGKGRCAGSACAPWVA